MEHVRMVDMDWVSNGLCVGCWIVFISEKSACIPGFLIGAVHKVIPSRWLQNLISTFLNLFWLLHNITSTARMSFWLYEFVFDAFTCIKIQLINKNDYFLRGNAESSLSLQCLLKCTAFVFYHVGMEWCVERLWLVFEVMAVCNLVDGYECFAEPWVHSNGAREDPCTQKVSACACFSSVNSVRLHWNLCALLRGCKRK